MAAATALIVLMVIPAMHKSPQPIIQVAMLDLVGATRGTDTNEAAIFQQAAGAATICYGFGHATHGCLTVAAGGSAPLQVGNLDGIGGLKDYMRIEMRDPLQENNSGNDEKKHSAGDPESDCAPGPPGKPNCILAPGQF